MNWEKILQKRLSGMSEAAKLLVDEVMSDGKERTHIEIIDEIKGKGKSTSRMIPTINELRNYLKSAVDPDDYNRRKFVRTGRDNFNNYLKYKIVSDEDYSASRGWPK